MVQPSTWADGLERGERRREFPQDRELCPPILCMLPNLPCLNHHSRESVVVWDDPSGELLLLGVWWGDRRKQGCLTLTLSDRILPTKLRL